MLSHVKYISYLYYDNVINTVLKWQVKSKLYNNDFY